MLHFILLIYKIKINSLQVVNESKAYWCYAKIVLHFGQYDENYSKIELTNEIGDKAFSLLQKSLRCLLNVTNWELEKTTCSSTIETANGILESNFKK